jgi:hypothetical protein
MVIHVVVSIDFICEFCFLSSTSCTSENNLWILSSNEAECSPRVK